MLVPVAFLLLATAPAAAQQRGYAGLRGGVIMAQGDLADVVDNGWGLILLGRYSRARSAVGGQVDFQYWNVPAASGSNDLDIFASTLNLVLTFPQRTDA
ncbi:MAG: hypothetical protein ACREMV_07940, partial [Gemmatimonadales bacterium]